MVFQLQNKWKAKDREKEDCESIPEHMHHDNNNNNHHHHHYSGRN